MTDSEDADAATRAREARYAEAVVKGFYVGIGTPVRNDSPIVEAVLAVADAEQTELRAEVERLQEDIRALADEWDGGEEVGVAHVVACKDFGCTWCPVIACATDLRALLAPSPAATTGEHVWADELGPEIAESMKDPEYAEFWWRNAERDDIADWLDRCAAIDAASAQPEEGVSTMRAVAESLRENDHRPAPVVAPSAEGAE